jgi:hypothetical protein
MTEKEKYWNGKLAKKKQQTQKKMIISMKKLINMKLAKAGTNEDKQVELLAELRALEINDLKLRRNKFMSESYSFEPVDRKRLW